MAEFQTTLIVKKIIKLKEIVQRTIRSNQLYKTLGFIEATDLNACVIYAEAIYAKLTNLLPNSIVPNVTNVIDTLQEIVIEISTLISLYGCDTLENLIHICIGHKFSIDDKYKAKYDLLANYIKPVRYRLLDWHAKLSSADEIICKTADNFDCFDLENEIFNINFQYRIAGIKIAIHNMEKQHTLLVYGVTEDIMSDFIENTFIANKLTELQNKVNVKRFLTLKDLMIYPIKKLENKYITYQAEYATINTKPLVQIINEFVEAELYEKRNTLIMLLLNSTETEGHYLAYLLYDLLSNDINGIIDTYEQTLIYDSLPYNVKKYFRDIMKEIVSYTNKLSNVNISKISLEQRICLMKANDVVKEKAMVKLKEVKMKSEDTGSKAMQFLDGLLKIPFEIYKEEPVLKLIGQNIKQFSTLALALKSSLPLPFPFKHAYTNLEIQKYLPLLKGDYKEKLYQDLLEKAKAIIATSNKKTIVELYGKLKCMLFVEKVPIRKCTGKTIKQWREEFIKCIEECVKVETVRTEIYVFFEMIIGSTPTHVNELNTCISQIEANNATVSHFMRNVSGILDTSVYGHTNAKRQIERIIGQWLSGDITGYCFGFEGPPGVGKTSLAKKGIAQCLLDEKGIARPFSFIAMGGSTNSSTLDGHNYTYVGSTWGRIVDILMDTKIMNPIIFIDELDKVSKTENGKEIIGILTHLIDQTQNDSFQDKYFNGINLNLSKALFIFSYNDADLIDKILLDRIHRIKFDAISVEDKLIIMRNFILPEIYKKMGLEEMIDISDAVIEYIIQDYTAEPGVRKLKELMFEIMGEINLELLKDTILNEKVMPFVITIDDIKQKYLKDHNEVRPMKIHTEPLVGVINGMWANSVGKGGILPIEASYYPSSTFLELKLTGMQGDVMKESMTVAKSVAWSLVKKEEISEEKKNQGIHIHVPEGATPKDGPSAGTAITMVLYSLFSGRKIKNDVAITGEICLQGRVTAIGGLELKILGGIRAGVKTFIYPKENDKDFMKFMKKYGNKPLLSGIMFVAVERIEEVIPFIFI
jgi:hypothetical protein